MGQLVTILWRDIPAQVTARAGRTTAKRELHRRFQVAIDRAAVKAGLHTASDYIGEWRREARPCSDDLEAEVAAAAEALESAYTRERLKALVESGGIDPARPASPSSEADPS
jgi:hypothetical protein